MKRTFTTLFLCACPFAYTQSINFGGYLNAKMQIIDLADTAFVGHTETFRLEATRDISTNAALEAHVLFSSSFESISPSSNFKDGSFMQRSMDEITEGMLQGFGLDSGTSSELSLTDDPRISNLYYSTMIPKDAITLDRAVLKLYFKKADLYIGKQVIAWGTGYAWNPTDFWNQKSPTDPEAAKLGVTAIRTTIALGALSSLDVAIAPGLGLDQGSAGIRFKTNLLDFDLSFMTAREMTPDRVVYDLPPKWIAGFDIAGDIIDGIGIWIEAAFTNRIFSGQHATNMDSSYISLDAGATYTFDNGMTLMAEYFYNGLGQNSSDNYTTVDFMNMFTGEMTGLGRHYAFLNLSTEFGDFYKAGLSGITNASDFSFTIIPTISYSWNNDMLISLGANIFMGDLKSEFGSLKPIVYGEVKGYF